MAQQDSQTYAKAANVGLIGMVVQFILAVLLALIGVYARHTGVDGTVNIAEAILTTAWAAALGLPAWAVIQIYLGQLHKEHAELLETRALTGAQDGQGMFEEASLAEVRRRLARLQKFGFAGVSLFMALFQIALGAYACYAAKRELLSLNEADAVEHVRRITEGTQGSQAANPVLVLLGLGLIVLASFFLARYVAGMTRQKQWQILRGGASLLLAVSGMGILLALAWTLAIWGHQPKALAWAACVIPALMVVQGLETVVVFLFGMYSPRKAGELPRPAFDSRLLGWLSGPESLGRLLSETLRYQFGFEVSSSWFFQLLSKAFLPLSALTALLVLGASCLFIVAPHERAVIVNNGKLGRVCGPGLYFKAPWPFSQVRSFEVDRVQRLVIAGHPFDSDREIEAKKARTKEANEVATILWTGKDESGIKEELLMTAPGEVMSADIAVLYRMDGANLQDYLLSAENPTQILEAIATQEVAHYFATHTTDDLLGDGRHLAAAALKDRIAAAAKRKKLGLDVLEISLAGLRPPQTVAAAFLEKANARQEAETQVKQAVRQQVVTLTDAAGSPEKAEQLGQAIKAYTQAVDAAHAAGQTENPEMVSARARVEALMERAGGQAADALYAARASRWSRAGEEFGKAKRFDAMLQAYRAAPGYFRQRRVLDAMAATMADRPKMVIDHGIGGEHSTGSVRLQLQDGSGGGDILGGGR